MQLPRFFHSKSFTLLQQTKSAFTANLLPFCNKTKALSQQIFYPLATKQKRFQSKSFTLSQQNKSAFTANLLPFCNKTKAISKQIFYHLAKTKGLEQQNKSS